MILTLKDFSYAGEGKYNKDITHYDTDTTASILYTGNHPLKIVLEGTNTIEQTNHPEGDSRYSSSAIYTTQPMTITGTGSLNVTGGDCLYYCVGINSLSDVTIEDGKVTAKGKGTCYVYAYAHNGVYKKVKVTVK